MTSLPEAIGLLALHIVLTTLPVIAGLLAATAFGVRDRLLVLSIGLCSLMVTGYLTFWVFWANAHVGKAFAIALTPGLVIVVVWLGVRTRPHLKSMGVEYLPPFLLWAASSMLIFSLGSMFPTSHIATTTAESRFVAPLPIDNEVPLIVATALQNSHRPIAHPLYGVWDSSDRPPLQAGVYLSQEALLPGSDMDAQHYEVVGILLQGLWIFGIWGLLASIRARSRLVGLVLTAILFSGFTLVNTFFTWPKLFAAAYLALLAGMLLTPNFERFRSSAIAGATAGALAGAALLGHEGSGLALGAFVVVMLLQRSVPSKRFVLGALALLVATQGTWMAYQKFIDPPGDQLARLQIANQIVLPGDTRPLLDVIVSQYQKAPFSTIVHDKVSNLETPFTDVPSYVMNTVHLLDSYLHGGNGAEAQRKAAQKQLITANFFYIVPSLGFLSLGFFAWIAAVLWSRSRPTPVLRFAGTVWVYLAINLVSWALILFGPSATFIHQGTYVTELLAFTACVIGLWELWRPLCTALVLFQAGMTVIVYGLNGPEVGVPEHLDNQMLALAVIGLVATVATLFYVSTRTALSEENDPQRAPDAPSQNADRIAALI